MTIDDIRSGIQTAMKSGVAAVRTARKTGGGPVSRTVPSLLS